MNICTAKVESFTITGVPRLDPVTVFLQDLRPGAGRLTVECFGTAWSATWGGMRAHDLRDFLVECDAEYVSGKLAPTTPRQPSKGEESYRLRITQAVLGALRMGRPVVPAAELPAGMTGAELIAAERKRQIEVEGWSAEHDANHAAGQLAAAAACYIEAVYQMSNGAGADEVRNAILRRGTSVRWPWEKSWLKVSPDPVRNLVKAGALITAEIDRLKRSASSASAPLRENNPEPSP